MSGFEVIQPNFGKPDPNSRCCRRPMTNVGDGIRECGCGCWLRIGEQKGSGIELHKCDKHR